ncbi:LuxR C-terminal-related transcriptional regulator [Cupriavidus basilensis]|uniref:LuxR C-terminal-related transcriptional regulator n=1 Tax=Cupriavidus basilensis TaxID=68895 RepID=A0ABT6AU37_9BURK|nr:LuxR C-terminal-related transcriptional regulator [Cupriavidus basilensis]MDF3835196.1 LuxR C-terminal-related transcriptional regulator [Cupriavidus basilensis]
MSDATPPWEHILGTARDLIGADSGSLIMMDGCGSLLNLNHVDIPTSTLDDYAQHFHKLDVVADAAIGLSAGTWLDSNELLSQSKLQRTEFYGDYLHKHGQAQILALIVEQNPDRRTAFSFQRSTVAPGAREKLTQGDIGVYVRTFQAALERRSQSMAMNLQMVEDTFTSLGEATCLVSVAGVVLRASPLARAILDNRSGLCTKRGRLWHPARVIFDQLSKKLGDTLRTGQRTKLIVSLAWGETMSLDITPASPHIRLSNEPLALIRLRRNSAMGEADTVALISIFDITNAEAKVLAGLVAGVTPAGFATMNGVSENTVRKQIANLKTKMRCNRVVDLVKLALLAQR